MKKDDREEVNWESIPEEAYKDAKRRNTAKSYLYFFAALAVCLVIILFGLGKSTEIDVNDFVSVSFSGYEGYGTAETAFSESSFISGYGAGISINESKTSKADGYEWASVLDEDATAATKLYEILEYGLTVSPAEGLSEGDTVTVSLFFEKAEIKAIQSIFGVKISFDKFTETVPELSETKEIDPFENLEIIVYEDDGDLCAEITDGAVSRVEYEITSVSEAEGGAEVVVAAYTDTVLYGYVLTSEEETFFVKITDAKESKKNEAEDNSQDSENGISNAAEREEDVVNDFLEELGGDAYDFSDSAVSAMEDAAKTLAEEYLGESVSSVTYEDCYMYGDDLCAAFDVDADGDSEIDYYAIVTFSDFSYDGNEASWTDASLMESALLDIVNSIFGQDSEALEQAAEDFVEGLSDLFSGWQESAK